MKKHLLLITLLILGVTFFSCKRKYQIVPPPTPSSSIHDTILKNREDSRSLYYIGGGAGGDFTTDAGIQFHIPYYSFRDLADDTVLSTVTIEVIEILDPSDMILLNRPTTSSNAVLVTGGQFKVSFSVNGNPVFIGDSTIFARVPTADPDLNMIMFEGTEDNTTFVDWTPVTDGFGANVPTPVSVDTINGALFYYYDIVIDSTISNWINCDYFYNFNSPKTDITLTLPELHDNSNTFMFVHFDGIQSVMAGYFDGDNFVTPATIPIGSLVTIVIISEIDDNYYSKFIPITVGSGYSATITPDPTTYADMINSIVNL